AANLELSDAAGSGTLADVIARSDDALVVTSLWYIRDVDLQAMLVTGLTRDGTYVVRDGRIVGGAGNFRFNDSPLAVLGRIVDAGAPVRCLPREWADYFTRTSMPPLVVRDFGLSTASAAT
ncbi:MAG: metallopeptidase TldD-related protein, partial [Candidatus Nanopelagicales bacterium]